MAKKKIEFFEVDREAEEEARRVDLGERGTKVIQAFLESNPDWLQKFKIKSVTTEEEFFKVMQRCAEVPIHGSDTEANGLDFRRYQDPNKPVGVRANNHIVGLCVAPDSKHGYYIPVRHKVGPNLDPEMVFSEYRKVIEKSKPVFHNAAFDINALIQEGIDISDPDKFEDTFLAAKLGDDGSKFKRPFDQKSLTYEHLQWDPLDFNHVCRHKIKNKYYFTTFDYIDSRYAYGYAAVDPLGALLLWPIMSQMKFFKMQPQIYHLEKAVLPVVNEMVYQHRLTINTQYVKAEAEKLERTKTQNRLKMNEIAGYDFNPGSPKQVSQLLFEKLRLPTAGIPKNTQGYSTGEEVLQKLKDKHEVVQLILEDRHLTKQIGTYAVGFIEDVDEMNTLCCGLISLGPDTGRFAGRGSKNPSADGVSRMSILTIPKNYSGEGLDFRKAIIAPPGYILIDADYSGEELRFFANMSGEEIWIKKLGHEDDVHRATASLFYGVEENEVSKDQRKHGKAANFLIIYGGSFYKLAKDFNLETADAEQRYNRIMSVMKNGKAFIEGRRAFTNKNGYAKTYFGRIRPLPHIKSDNMKQRGAAGRQAINTPIQGTGADVLKILLVRLRSIIKEKGWDEPFNEIVKILLPVHDEVLIAAKIEHVQEVLPVLFETMEAIKGKDWKVPLSVEAEISYAWSTNDAVTLARHKGKILKVDDIDELAEKDFSEEDYPKWSAREHLLEDKTYEVNINDLVKHQLDLLEKELLKHPEVEVKEPEEESDPKKEQVTEESLVVEDNVQDKEIDIYKLRYNFGEQEENSELDPKEKEKKKNSGLGLSPSNLSVIINGALTKTALHKLKAALLKAKGGPTSVAVLTNDGNKLLGGGVNINHEIFEKELQ